MVSFKKISLRTLFILTVVTSMAGWGVCLWLTAGHGPWLLYVIEGIIVVTALLLVVLYVRMLRPMRVLVSSMEMLRCGDWNDRLLPTGQTEADKVADVFNELFDRLKNQRVDAHRRQRLLEEMVKASKTGIVIYGPDGSLVLSNSFADEVMKEKEYEELSDKPDCVITIRDRRIHCVRYGFREEGMPYTFSLYEDITDAVLRAEADAYGKIIRIMNHELNNTAGGLRAALQIAAEDAVDDDVRYMLQSAEKRVDSLTAFLRRYAEVVRLPEANLRPSDISDLIRINLPFLQSLAAGKDIIVRIGNTQPVMAMADDVMLSQVLVNAVKNSIESIMSGTAKGEIVIEAHTSGSEVQLTVTDNGPGLEAPLPATPFYTNKTGGQGCGLTQAREIAARHGGSLSLVTTEEGVTVLTLSMKRTF